MEIDSTPTLSKMDRKIKTKIHSKKGGILGYPGVKARPEQIR
jgi:hypothetical protein